VVKKLFTQSTYEVLSLKTKV